FLHRFEKMAAIETEIRAAGEIGLVASKIPEGEMRKWKGFGFNDLHIADALSGFPSSGYSTLQEGADQFAVTQRRHELSIHPRFRMVDSCAAEFAAITPYYYATYEGGSISVGIDYVPELATKSKQRIVVIGSGPIRIGQGIEFDYGCVHAVGAIQDLGQEAIIINNNPETVSTDFDTSDRLYFDPLTLESVSEILLREDAHGILLQFGGQTAINLALPLSANLPHLSTLGLDLVMEGTTPEAVDEASDRERFEAFAKRNGLRMPNGTTATTPEGVRDAVREIGYPVLIRPSYVLGGRGMEILSSNRQLDAYMQEAFLSPERPLLVDEYLGNAIELDVDAVCDGNEVLIGAIMEHLEEAGIHSGDSTCFIPPQTISQKIISEVEEWTRIIGLELGIVGCYNIQFAIRDETVYVLEVNPRGSRTFPFVAKSTGIPLARIAARLALGEKLVDLSVPEPQTEAVCVKAPVFPFIKLRGLDPAPGPEMKSTGEVMGSHERASAAYLKARLATESPVPTEGGVYITVKDADKHAIIEQARDLVELGFQLYATRGTAHVLRDEGGLDVQTCYRITERKTPDALDLMRQGKIHLIINTPRNTGGAVLDGNMMRRLAVELNIPFVTTMAGARMEVLAIGEMRLGMPEPRLLTIGSI
ncbi:MAG: carbamoyl-phosphate synthase large subunit, partial [Euryarchaeota archaeon]|nr:carbamoyl-phosphate synthase large subunit [Euryarchaeota archaeon]